MSDGIARPLRMIATVVSTVLMSAWVNAQDAAFYQSFSHRIPPEQTAGRLPHIRCHQGNWLQPVEITVPDGAEISIYAGATQPVGMASSPTLVAVNPGHIYRLRLTNMPEFPHAELYPSIEILDRLHPPPGKENHYPIPILFSKDDIGLALAGRLVTRVIYLEQPRLAQQLDPLNREIAQAVLPSENVLEEADRLGRPMIIVRIGDRHPSRFQTSSSFFGTGGDAQMRSDEFTVRRPPQINRVAQRVR